MGTGNEAGSDRRVFWGKFHSASQYLPLAAHCLDVGLVLRSLCDLEGIRRTLIHAAGESLSSQQLDRLAVLAMLHDAGKANLGFQQKVFDARAPRAGHVRELAPLMDLEALDEELHARFLQCLPPDLPSWFPNPETAYSYLLASFSHHGRPVRFQGEMSGTYWQARKTWWRPAGAQDPMAAVAEIVRWAQQAFPHAFVPGCSPLPQEPAFHHRFAGLVILADWLGSHSHWFPVRQVGLQDRLQADTQGIPGLLRAVGLDIGFERSILARGPEDFLARFDYQPRPLQEAIDDLDPDDGATALLVAESETGSGKTEAALNWFFKLFAAGKVDGLYFALPTRVAARELYGRIHRSIQRWFPDPDSCPVTVLAVPGYAPRHDLPPERALPNEEAGNRWQDDDSLHRRERQWAAERPKRFLAATVAVGTVDQALLSIVQTAHAHLRSACLGRSLLVVDEVHASDFYMSRLLEFLVDQHLAVGGRAMLLSATLGVRACRRYLRGKGPSTDPIPDLIRAQCRPYPALTLADGIPRPTGAAGPAREVHFEEVRLAFNPELVAGPLLKALSAGARVVVIMNTVARANALLRVVEAHAGVDRMWLFTCHGVVCPHHGRFAPEDREVLDARVTERLGPESPPGPLLLVGTQTLEQSLDIDADLMVSDLAPADVLLQRVGRLHRHQRTRPSGYEEPRCLLLTPGHSLESALEARGRVKPEYKRIGYGSVYEDLRTLELTLRTLGARPRVSIPADNRLLVEAVTHPQSLASLPGEAWQRHAQNIEGGELAQTIAAGNAAAAFDRLFGEFAFNEAGGKLAVRLGADSLQLPLDRAITSPFGQVVGELVIPGHLAPDHPPDAVTVEDSSEGATILRCGNRRYRYSRYGLEEAL